MTAGIRIDPWAQDVSESVRTHRRTLHRIPELGFQEHKTAEYLRSQLARHPALELRTGLATTGITATLRNGDGPCVALRADMDALPLQEKSDAEYRSTHDGVSHACGHDGHMAMLLGTIDAVMANRDAFKGTLKFIFQPAEEGLGGARVMIRDGALRDPTPDAIFGLHLWNYQALGTVGVAAGPVLASSDHFVVDVKGRGGHGATPHGTVDAVLVASHMVVALQSLVSRNVDPLKPAVVSVGQIEAGQNYNIIAETARLVGTVRAYDEDVRCLLKGRLQEMCAGIAASHGGGSVLTYSDGYPPTVNDPAMTEVVRRAAAGVVGEAAAGPPYLSMGAEDMAFYLQQTPGCFFFVGSAPDAAAAGTRVPHHCPHFDFDERALDVGVSVFLGILRDRLGA